jgi:hypothetical protein
MGEKRNVCRVLVGKPVGENHLEDIDADWRVILKSIFMNRMSGCGLDSSVSG